MSLTVMEAPSYTDTPDPDMLLHAWRELDVPEGWQAEIIDGDIRLMAPPSNPHNLVTDLVQETLFAQKPAGCGLYQTLGIYVASLGQLYVPDLVVMPRTVVRETAAPAAADAALIAVEVVSRHNGDHDRKKKLWGYAHAPVPLYLLIDRWNPAGPIATLYENPQGGQYMHSDAVTFGKTLTIPAPFEVELDTAEFPSPDEWH